MRGKLLHEVMCAVLDAPISNTRTIDQICSAQTDFIARPTDPPATPPIADTQDTHKQASIEAMGPFPFWRRSKGGSTPSGSGGGKKDDSGAGALRGFAAFFRALPPAAPGTVRFFARDQVMW